MKLLIIEDEIPASNRIRKLVHEIDPSIEIVAVIDSVEDGIKWFRNYPHPDIVLTDIQLADGLSFEIFEQSNLQTPLIFTTAYDNYALKAFKVNGIDYLLKPINKDELRIALEKTRSQRNRSADLEALARMLQQGEQAKYKERFMVKIGDELRTIKTTEISYFISEDGYTHLVHKDGQKRIVDYSLDQLNEMLDPQQFQRINRGTMVSIDSIEKITPYFNSRLKVKLQPGPADTIVSRERVNDFKRWLDQ